MSYNLNAYDISGISEWWINDTINFMIDSNGLITNRVSLSLGVYWLEVRAYDVYGRYCSKNFKVVVEGDEGSGDNAIPGYYIWIILSTITLVSLILINKRIKRYSF